jgi:hypothetical protein
MKIFLYALLFFNFSCSSPKHLSWDGPLTLGNPKESDSVAIIRCLDFLNADNIHKK